MNKYLDKEDNLKFLQSYCLIGFGDAMVKISKNT